MKPDRLSLPEFVALSAMLIAVLAFSVDAMLPALPRIADDLAPGSQNSVQLVVTSFVLGLGLGTFIAGPLSDSFGRMPVISVGLVIYVAAGLWAMQAQSLDTLLAARVVQGFAAAAPRIVTLAMIRDLYEGRRMAQAVSFVMTVFVIFPAFAPAIGAGIVSLTGTWRAIFASFALFGVIALLWFNLRQRETLVTDHRRPFKPRALWSAFREVLSNRLVVLYIVVLTLGFSQFFAFLSSIQQIYDETYGRGDTFHIYFIAMGLLSASGTLLNASLVMRLGMRRLAMSTYGAQAGLSSLLLILKVTGALPPVLEFPAFFFWGFTLYAMFGLTAGNLNALALEPMGHIAGMASSVVGAISAIAALPVAVLTGLAFQGTEIPVMLASAICSALAYWLMRRARVLDPTPKTKLP